MKSTCINLGCGLKLMQGNEIEEWFNIDWADDLEGLYTPRGAIFKHDLRDGLPGFLSRPDSISFINMSQFFEHLNLTDGIKLLKQCHEVMIKNNSRIRISVPDAGLLLDRYEQERMDEFCDVQPEIYTEMNQPFIRLALMLFGSLDKDGSSGHKMMYSFTSLKYLLEHCGFKDICYEQFNERYDTSVARNHQLVVEARA